MDKSAAFSRALLRSVFVADPLPFAGNAQLFVSLHVADPGKDGDQTSHECAFASYARQAVNRSDGSWSTVDQPDGSCAIRNVAAVSFPTCTGYSRVALTKASAWTDGGSSFTNANLIQFGACTAGNNTISHFAVVDTASGAVNMMLWLSCSCLPNDKLTNFGNPTRPR